MPMVNVPECDVFATRGHDVFMRMIDIKTFDSLGNPVPDVPNVHVEPLLSQRAFDRLLAALEPPKRRKKTPQTEPDDEAEVA